MKKLVLAVSLLLVPLAFTQTLPPDQSVTIKPQWALQGFNPLNPSAVTHPVITATSMNTNAVLSQFTVTNYSAKAVTSIEYGWRIDAPTACSNSTFPLRWETASADVNIPPGAEANITAAESLSRTGAAPELAAQARASNTPVVLVTIGIVKVTFADGSTWSDDEAVQRNTWDSNYYEKHEGCHPPTVRRVKG